MSEDQHPHTARVRRVADLLRRRNAIDAELASIIDRPAEKGHVGEWLASVLFDIELERSAANPSWDGRFRSGPHAGRTVDIKWYARREGLLDINPATLPDCYLVLTGPPGAADSSRGASRPWIVTDAFLFETEALLQELRGRGVAIGIATSVRQDLWERSRCRPSGDAAAAWDALIRKSGGSDPPL